MKKIRLPTELKKLDRSPVWLLHRAEQLATEIFTHEMGVIGLTRSQFMALLCLQRRPGISQKELAEEAGTDNSTMAEMAARLAEAGLIERVRAGQGKRGFTLSLTVSGKRKLKNAQYRAAQADRNFLFNLDPEQRSVMLAGLIKLNEALKKLEKASKARKKQIGKKKQR